MIITPHFRSVDGSPNITTHWNLINRAKTTMKYHNANDLSEYFNIISSTPWSHDIIFTLLTLLFNLIFFKNFTLDIYNLYCSSKYQQISILTQSCSPKKIKWWQFNLKWKPPSASFLYFNRHMSLSLHVDSPRVYSLILITTFSVLCCPFIWPHWVSLTQFLPTEAISPCPPPSAQFGQFLQFSCLIDFICDINIKFSAPIRQ